MKIKEIGHLGFTCKDLAVSIDFYKNKLGMIHKFDILYGQFLEHLEKQAAEAGRCVDEATVARLTPIKDKVWISYFDLGNCQFIELFDAGQATIPCIPNDSCLNYSHLAIVVDDIHAAHEEFAAKGVPIDSAPSLGLEGTWQMWAHDPDGNKIEFMEYTPASWQLKTEF